MVGKVLNSMSNNQKWDSWYQKIFCDQNCSVAIQRQLWTAVDQFKPWVLGDHSVETLWEIVGKWKCYFLQQNPCTCLTQN